VYGYNGRNILTSSDKGNTWNAQSANPRLTYYHAQSFNDSTFIISGDRGIMRKTYDYGESWKQLGSVPSVNANPPRFFNFTDSLHGYAATDELAATNDGGKSWTKKTLPWEPQIFPLTAMLFIDSLTGFVVDYGSIYKTANGAVSWTQTGHSTGNSFISGIIFTPEGKGFTVGYDGDVLKSSDKGNTWQRYDLHSTDYLTSVYFYNNSIGFIGTSDSIIYKTTDGGNTWKRINTHIDNVQFVSFTFKDSLNGYMLGSNSNPYSAVYRTKDGAVHGCLCTLIVKPREILQVATMCYTQEEMD
jgi:photosystem II stability/assembly factor-like uncharacterized protein